MKIQKGLKKKCTEQVLQNKRETRNLKKIAKNAIFINLGKPNSNEGKVNFDMTFFKIKIEPLLTHQNPKDDMIIYPNNWTSEGYEDCGCGMGYYTKKDLRKDLKHRK